jgi:hypothetical protein
MQYTAPCAMRILHLLQCAFLVHKGTSLLIHCQALRPDLAILAQW